MKSRHTVVGFTGNDLIIREPEPVNKVNIWQRVELRKVRRCAECHTDIPKGRLAFAPMVGGEERTAMCVACAATLHNERSEEIAERLYGPHEDEEDQSVSE